MKQKYKIGQILKYKINDMMNISEITSIEFNNEKIVYHFKDESLYCDEIDVISSYTKDKVRAKRNSKKKARINLNEEIPV